MDPNYCREISFGLALFQLINMYGAAITDPMKETAATDGKAVRDAMLFWAGIGAVGVLPFIIGSVMLKAAMVRRVRAALHRK